MLEPAFSTMLTFPRLGILPAGPISRPGGRVPPRRLRRRGTLVLLIASTKGCSVPLTVPPRRGWSFPDLTPRRIWVTLWSYLRTTQELQDVDPSYESESPNGISAHGRSNTSEACFSVSAIARHNPDKFYRRKKPNGLIAIPCDSGVRTGRGARSARVLNLFWRSSMDYEVHFACRFYSLWRTPTLVVNSLTFTSVPLLAALSGPDAVGAPEDVFGLTAFSAEESRFSNFSISALV